VTPGRRRAQCGQGSIEVIAAVPVIALAALAAWQFAAVIGAGLAATERARAQAIAHRSDGGIARFEERVAVPRVLPFGEGLTVSALAAVKHP
jgi:hypothetical protein